jgi:hypothetical protein
MSDKATKRYKEAKDKALETLGNDRNPEPFYDFSKPEGRLKAAAPSDREASDSVINDYPSESIVRESNSTENNEVKLRTKSDKEC